VNGWRRGAGRRAWGINVWRLDGADEVSIVGRKEEPCQKLNGRCTDMCLQDCNHELYTAL